MVFVCFGHAISQYFTFEIIDYLKCRSNGSSWPHLDQMLEFSINRQNTSQCITQHCLYTLGIVNKLWQCVRCSVLGLYSEYRPVHNCQLQLELGSPASMLEPLEFVSGSAIHSNDIFHAVMHTWCRCSLPLRILQAGVQIWILILSFFDLYVTNHKKLTAIYLYNFNMFHSIFFV